MELSVRVENKVALKEILNPMTFRKIKVGETDTYWIYMQNNSGKKITVKWSDYYIVKIYKIQYGEEFKI